MARIKPTTAAGLGVLRVPRRRRSWRGSEVAHTQYFTRFTFVTNVKLGSLVVGQVIRGRAMSSADDGVWLACMRSGRRECPGGRKTAQ